jgi:hypothetical protein
MTIYLTDFTRALIRRIPEHFLGHTRYSDGALREVADELRRPPISLSMRSSIAW